MSYFSDRIITPNFLSAMALLYLGQNSSANPLTDMLLSPVVTPDEILEEFPKVWIMCGECDPFVDDSVVFAARVRHAVAKKREREMEMASAYEEMERQKMRLSSAAASANVGESNPAVHGKFEDMLSTLNPF
jgi:acetyl esterase/lipase